MEIQQKQYQSKIDGLTDKGRVLIAVNAFDNEDSDRDISKPGSYKKTLKENFNRVRWFLNHDTTKLLGVPIEGKETGQYLQMLGQLNLEKQIARDTYEDYKLYAEHGKTLEHSVGVQAVKFSIDNDSGIRTITEWKLWEFSTLTSWGANENTPLLGIKSMDELKDLITEMSNNSRYSDDRKRAIENTHKALSLVEPSRVSLDDRAALRDIYKLLKIN